MRGMGFLSERSIQAAKAFMLVNFVIAVPFGIGVLGKSGWGWGIQELIAFVWACLEGRNRTN
jgi:hypothetical protein